MNVRRFFEIVCVLALIGCGVVGCAYTTQSTLNPKYKTIYVEAFRNASREYDLQAPLTNAIRRKFLTDGRLKVTSKEKADLILEGTIQDVRLKGLTYDANDETVQFLCVVIASARCIDAQTGEPIWEDKTLAGETTFYTRASGQSSDRLRGNAEVYLPVVRSFSTEEENRGVSEALEQLASDIFYRTIEPW